MSAAGSRLDELRKYRFKNGTSPSKSETNGESTTATNGDAQTAPVRKRIRVISLSDSSGDENGVRKHPKVSDIPTQNGSPPPPPITLQDRSDRLAELKRQFPSVDTMTLQEELLRTDWTLSKAAENMKQKQILSNNTAANGHHSSQNSKQTFSGNASGTVTKHTASHQHKVNQSHHPFALNLK